jgi:hypothetical protein
MREIDMGSIESGSEAGGFRLSPRGLPLFCGLVPVIWCVTYGLTLLIVGSHLGRQSSTAGIPAVFSIMAALPLSLLGFLIGRVIALPLKHVKSARVARFSRWCALPVLIAVAVAASLQAGVPLYAAERAATPRILVNAANLQKRKDDPATLAAAQATRVYDSLGKINLPALLDGDRVQLTDRGDELELRFEQGAPLRIPLPGIDYINFVDAIALKPVRDGSATLALLITGRATGQRDLLAVVSQVGELVYLELLERQWDFRTVSLAAAPSPTGDLIIVGLPARSRLAYGMWKDR